MRKEQARAAYCDFMDAALADEIAAFKRRLAEAYGSQEAEACSADEGYVEVLPRPMTDERMEDSGEDEGQRQPSVSGAASASGEAPQDVPAANIGSKSWTGELAQAWTLLSNLSLGPVVPKAPVRAAIPCRRDAVGRPELGASCEEGPG